MIIALLTLAAAAHAAEPRPVLRFEHAFDTVGGWSSTREFSRDGKTFVVQGNAGVTVWDAGTGVQRALVPAEFKECGKDKYCGKAFVAVSPDGKLAVIDVLRNVYRGAYPDTNSERFRKGDYGSYRGDRDDVYSKGFICPKGSAIGHLEADPDRLRRRDFGTIRIKTYP